MKLRFSAQMAVIAAGLLAGAAAPAGTAAEAAAPASPPPKRATNYDEARVGSYTLPDPLALDNGGKVRDAETWFNRRRPELVRLYERHVYGRVPETAPAAAFEIVRTDPGAREGKAIRKDLRVRFGDRAGGPAVDVAIYLPPAAGGPVPLLLQMNFFGNPPPADAPTPPPAPAETGRRRPVEFGPIDTFLERGYGFATFRYSEIQPDNAGTYESGVLALACAPGQTKPAADEWGTITAWAWGASRILDYFQQDPAIDATRVALIGHSRLGKTALWAGARDPRFALVVATCSGEMGASLSRRDFGETVDNVAGAFPWWCAANFQAYVGRWGELPVDAHTLIALNAPHPVFITGGTEDQWADPVGMFLATVAAGPVYRLVGRRGLGTSEIPLDTPLVEGSLAFNYHTGGHVITPAEWEVFLDFADRHLKAR